MLAWKSAYKKVRRERHFMSKKSCEAAESVEDAVLRMARVNCNLVERGSRFHACMKICLQEGTKGAPFYEQK